MPYNAAIDNAAAIVRVHISGCLRHEEHLAVRMKAARLCSEQKCRRLLVDLRDLVTGEENTAVTCFEFGSGYREAGLPDGTRVAHVLPRSSKARKDVDFTALVAANRGLIVKNFETVDQAENWLREI